ncbi:MAG: transporter substrate-binding domain-containing protein [Firmicutes bacterium]|nr:transporter substrate-binding domain-containing protein [Bacillota bacterium]
MKSNMLKKLFAVMMIMVLVLGCFAGCGGGDAEEETGNQGEATGDQSLQSVLDKGELHVAISPDYAPYEYLDLLTGEVKGSDVMFANYIGEKLGVKVVFDQMSFESCLAAVGSNSTDLMISCMGWSAERAESMELSEQYNIHKNIENTVLVKAENAAIKTGEEFAGMKIAAQNGSTMYDRAVTELPGAEVQAVSSIADGIMMLQDGKVDGVAMALNVAEEFCGNYEGLGIAEFRFVSEKNGNVVGAPKGDAAIIEAVNEIILEATEADLFVQWFEEASADAQKQGL